MDSSDSASLFESSFSSITSFKSAFSQTNKTFLNAELPVAVPLKPDRRWANGIVPYEIDFKSFERENQHCILKLIDKAINEEVNNKCEVVKFVPREGSANYPDYVLFKYNAITSQSTIGRLGGVQKIWLCKNCSLGTVLHEIMHTLGFMHEQQRTVNERYAAVKPNIPNPNMKPSQRSDGDMQVLLGIFDANSVMRDPCGTTVHVGANALARRFGKLDGLSDSDLKSIKFLYGPVACSYDVFGEDFYPQDYAECVTCMGQNSCYGICLLCAQTHHAGHQLTVHQQSSDIAKASRSGVYFVCDCGRDGHKLQVCSKKSRTQSRFICHQCFDIEAFKLRANNEKTQSICSNCAKRCHYGHDVRFYASSEAFACDCGVNGCRILCKAK